MGTAREPSGTQDKGLPFVLVQRALPNKYRKIGLYLCAPNRMSFAASSRGESRFVYTASFVLAATTSSCDLIFQSQG